MRVGKHTLDEHWVTLSSSLALTRLLFSFTLQKAKKKSSFQLEIWKEQQHVLANVCFRKPILKLEYNKMQNYDQNSFCLGRP